jgi:aspartate carbamoyltransferase catalytic subunit
MAEWCNVPVINAGDGLEGEHPTQFGVDLFAIHQSKGWDCDFDGMPIVIGGDLQSRVVRSNIIGLASYRPYYILVSDDLLRVPPDLRDYMVTHNLQFSEERDLKIALPDAKIIYWTRTQTDQRSQEQNAALAHIDLYNYQIREEHIDRTPPDCILMHPGPINREKPIGSTEVIVTEIVPELDRHPKSIYLTLQARAAIPTRMAELEWSCNCFG